MSFTEFRMRRLVELRDQELVEEIERENLLNSKLSSALEELEREMQERRVLEGKLERLASIDDLTGIFNRRATMVYLKKMMSLSDRNKCSLVLCLVDVDDLKKVNDSYGHEEGNVMLVSVAFALRESARNSDCVGRIGGDEFVAILVQCTESEAIHYVDRVKSKLHDSMLRTSMSYPIQFSYGFAEYRPDQKLTLELLFSNADQKMCAQKRARKAAVTAEN